MIAAAPAVVGNPFPGLRPFKESEKHLFFGREPKIDRMVDKLAAQRFLAVVGTSGAGKSSLVNCGLKPALRRGLLASAGTSWHIAHFRPGASPIRALASALADDVGLFARMPGSLSAVDLIEANLRLSGVGLVDIYQQARLNPDEANLLVYVDQFEELFRYRNLSQAQGPDFGADAVRFVRLLLEAVAQRDLPIYVALSMRSDFLGDCAHFDGLPEAINEGQYLVPRMTRDERRRAIEGPIQVAECNVSSALLTRLVNDVGDNPDQLSILQHAMNRTFARWDNEGDKRGSISLDQYEAVGTMTEALDRHAEKAYNELTSDRQKLICQRVFKAITDKCTDPRGIRRPTQMGKLCEITGATQDEIEDVIRVFRKPSRSFLLPEHTEKITPDSVIDISHESLMRVWNRLRNWADEEAEASWEYRRLSDRAEGFFAKRFGLMTDPDLQTALDFQNRQQPTQAWADLYGGAFSAATDYLKQSKERRDLQMAEAEVVRRWEARWQPSLFGVCELGFLAVLFNFHRSLMPNAIALPGPGTFNRFYLQLSQNAPRFIAVGLITVAFALLYNILNKQGQKLYRHLALQSALKTIGNPVIPSSTAASSIDIPSTPAVLNYAPVWRRGLALMIDVGIDFALFIIAVASFGQNLSLTYGTWVVLIFLYQTTALATRAQASLGMRALGIYVTGKNGSRLPYWKVLVRQLTKTLLYGTTLHSLFVLEALVRLAAFLIARRVFSEDNWLGRGQWLSDLAAGTIVLVRQKRPANSLARPIGSATLPAMPVA